VDRLGQRQPHHELHGREDARARSTFLLQILILAAMGSFIPQADGARGAAFAIAAAVLFAVLAVTALLPASARVQAWGVLDVLYLAGFAAVLYLADPPQAPGVTVSEALTERFGAFIIIVLGETLTGVVTGLSSRLVNALTLAVGLVAVVVGFGAWWTYFDFAGQRQPRPERAASVRWILGHLPLTAAVAAMGAAMVSLVDHAHDGRTPAATAWVLCAGAAAMLTTTMLLASTLPDWHRDRDLYRPLAWTRTASAVACLGLGAARPAPLLLALVLVVLLSIPWVFAVARRLATRPPATVPLSAR
jgi:low temperature requirement protein LtrA